MTVFVFHSAMPVYDAPLGYGRLHGTVSLDAVPVPFCQVQIHRSAGRPDDRFFMESLSLVRRVFADANGNWVADNVLIGPKYMTAAVDPLGGFDPAIKINLEAEPY